MTPYQLSLPFTRRARTGFEVDLEIPQHAFQLLILGHDMTDVARRFEVPRRLLAREWRRYLLRKKDAERARTRLALLPERKVERRDEHTWQSAPKLAPMLGISVRTLITRATSTAPEFAHIERRRSGHVTGSTQIWEYRVNPALTLVGGCAA